MRETPGVKCFYGPLAPKAFRGWRDGHLFLHPFPVRRGGYRASTFIGFFGMTPPPYVDAQIRCLPLAVSLARSCATQNPIQDLLAQRAFPTLRRSIAASGTRKRFTSSVAAANAGRFAQPPWLAPTYNRGVRLTPPDPGTNYLQPS